MAHSVKLGFRCIRMQNQPIDMPFKAVQTGVSNAHGVVLTMVGLPGTVRRLSCRHSLSEL